MIKFSNADPTFYDREFFLAQDNLFISLGRASYINGVTVYANNFDQSRLFSILTGRYTSISWNESFVMSYNHPYKDTVSTWMFNYSTWVKNSSKNKAVEPAKYNAAQFNRHHQIIIGNDVWIGCGVTVLDGIKIGNGAIIGTDAMLTKDIPSYAIVAGNPAKIIKYRFDEETRKKFMAVKWWNWDADKVSENVSLMSNPEKFLEKHYSPELENIPEEHLGGGGWD